MELALLLPLILLCGFIFNNRSRSHFYKLHRYSDQFLYLKIASSGFYIVVCSTLATFLLFKFVPAEYILRAQKELSLSIIFQHSELLTFTSNDADIDKETATMLSQFKAFAFLTDTVISIALSLIISKLYNFRLRYPAPFTQLFRICKNRIHLLVAMTTFCANKKNLREIIKTRKMIKIEAKNRKLTAETRAISNSIKDRPMDQFFLSASRSLQLVAISLDTNKVYVGFILSPGEINESEGLGPEIKIYPLASGFRHQEHQQLILTTEYPDSEKNAVFIKMDRITTVSNFDPETYHNVKPNDQPPVAKSSI